MSSTFFCKLDQLGFLSSFLCGIHCAITPIVITLLLATDAHKVFLNGWERLDFICLILAPIFAFPALKDGYSRHNSILPVVTFICGFLSLIIGYYFFDENIWHCLFMTLGGTTIAVAHFANLKLSRNHLACEC